MISGRTCTVYTVCAAIAGQGLPFSLSSIDATAMVAAAKGLSDFACTGTAALAGGGDYIEISGSAESCGALTLTNKYCGDVLTTETATAGANMGLNNPICGKFSCFCLPKNLPLYGNSLFSTAVIRYLGPEFKFPAKMVMAFSHMLKVRLSKNGFLKSSIFQKMNQKCFWKLMIS